MNVVLDHYPVASIRDIDISPGIFASGPWDKELAEVEDTALTLNDIEHQILRPIWRDRRVHYVLNCASVGCPNLPAAPVAGGSTETMLEAAALAYINDQRGVRHQGDRLVPSKIYDWFQEDFGGSEDGVVSHLRRYADPALAVTLAMPRIDHYAYDWSINDTG